MRFKTLLVYFMVLVSYPLTAQTDDPDEAFDDLAEEISIEMDDETSSEQMAEWLNELREHPVAINLATDENLSRLFWVTPLQSIQLRNYLTQYGPLLSIYELSLVPSFSRTDAERLAPFITLELPDSSFHKKPASQHWLILRSQRVIEKQDGFKEPENPTSSNHFTGDAFRHYLRYTFQNAHTILGLTAEKDAGEDFFAGSNPRGFDFYSGYFELKGRSFVKKIILGDYKASYGQGLTVNTTFTPSLTSAFSSLARNASGLSHYQSANENHFFRGGAAVLQFKNWEYSFWASSHKIDGNVISDSTGFPAVSSLQNTGSHATPSETEDEDAERISTIGSHISYLGTQVVIGLSLVGYQLDVPVWPDLQPYNQFQFRGSENYNSSVDLKYRYRNILFFGEEAISKNRGIAAINGLEAMLHPRFSLSLVHRYYQRDYQAYWGNAFGRNSTNSNETGLYAGCRWLPAAKAELSAYVDIYRFPWLKYGVDMPSEGRDLSLQARITPTRYVTAELLYRNRQQEQNAPGETTNPATLQKVSNQRVRASLQWKATPAIQLSAKLENTFYDAGTTHSKGYYFGHDLTFSFQRIPFKVIRHYAIFNIDDYNSRIYSYEKDLLYTFSIPMFYGKGTRVFLLAQYNLNKWLTCWLKYSSTSYTDRSTIGSGLWTIHGKTKQEVKAQVSIKF